MYKGAPPRPLTCPLGKGNVEDLTWALSLSQSSIASEPQAGHRQSIFRRFSLTGFSLYGFSSYRARPHLLIGCLAVVAGLSRVIGALTLINPDPDAYEYIEAVARMRAQ